MAGESRGSGPAQHWDPQRYNRNAGFVAELGAPLIDLLDPRPGERILDLGCGEGALTAKLLDAGAAVVGIDASPEQVAAARERWRDYKAAGHPLTYWQQGETGGWEKKADG